MTPETRPAPEVLGTSYFHRQWGDQLLGNWSLAFVRGSAPRQIRWVFRLEVDSSTLSRGYLDSVRQRFELAKTLPTLGDALEQILLDEGSVCDLVVEFIEGEPLTEYLKRTCPNLRASLGLLGNLILRLRELCGFPRLLSNLAPDDFLVCSRNGVSVETELHPVFSILREEVSKSDFEMATYWAELVAKIHAAARDGWEKEFTEYDPLSHRTFRRLLKKLQSGRELDMGETLEELQRCLRREVDSQRPSTDPIGEIPLPPLGPLRSSLFEEFALEYPEKLGESADSISPFSSMFLIPLRREGGDDSSKQGIILPPEGWFHDSLIGSVNQKMAIPFLSNHPNTQRTRALVCEERFTFVETDRSIAMPLPSLLELKGGFDADDAIRLAGKVRRALDQFESAEFSFELESPWQIEIYLVNETNHQEWKSLVTESCRNWPAWEVRIRVEIPAEAVIESSSATAWRNLLERLNGKVFPALLAWLLEWRRLEWAARENALEREPVSWDPRFDALFSAAAEHFEPLNPSHRDRLLSLINEGHESKPRSGGS